MKIGLLGALFLLFTTLKLTGTITWSWWWVTAPLWGGFALWFTVVVLILITAALIPSNKL